MLAIVSLYEVRERFIAGYGTPSSGELCRHRPNFQWRVEMSFTRETDVRFNNDKARIEHEIVKPHGACYSNIYSYKCKRTLSKLVHPWYRCCISIIP